MRVVFVDLPGSGMGSLERGQDYSFRSYVNDLEALRNRLDVEFFTILGHGWGAALAAEYALAHHQRVEALMLVNPLRVLTPVGQDSEAQARMVGRIDPTLLDRWVAEVTPRLQAALTGKEAWDSVEHLSWWSEMILTQFAALPPSSWSQSLLDAPWRMRAYSQFKVAAMSPGSAMARYDLADRARALPGEVPVLIFGSDNDANYVAPAAWHATPLHQALPSSQLVIWNDVGHFPFVERQDDFVSVAAKFCAGARI
jgi:proline iminopeptidase